MILLDYSSIAMSTIMAQIGQYEENPELIRHTIFNMIRRYNLEHRDEFGEMVICFDSKNNWRREVFPQYKAGRRKNRKNSVHDWETIFKLLDQVRQEVVEYTPYRTIQVEGCEADDVIGTLCEKQMTPEPILIVSPDTDFVQLQRYPNVRQFSNLQKKWIEPKVGPVEDLEEKILRGDTGDGVPNVMSDDEVLITEGARQTPLNKRKLEILKNDPEALGTTIARRIIRNRKMIDLKRTPEELKEEVLKKFKNKPGGSVTRLMTLFTKHQMKLLTESLSDFEVRINK